jgi:hypothetical protein
MSLSGPQYALIEARYGTLQSALDAATDPLLANAHIFVQGSIRMKTTIKPARGATGEMATVDADAVVWLPNAGTASAQDVLDAIEKRFSQATRVDEPVKPLRRGIRIVYADETPGFHMDITPARNAPGNTAVRGHGALLVPDRVSGWKESSPMPYSEWLETVGQLAIRLLDDDLTKRAAEFADATQDPLPDYDDYRVPVPLRAAVKLLKRHRDEWAIRTGKIAQRPISAVITTLAARAYEDVVERSSAHPMRPVEAIMAIVAAMPLHVLQGQEGWIVPNPRDARENFTEKWNRPGGEGAGYKQAFDAWHAQAKRDILLGLEDHATNDAFKEAFVERFGGRQDLIEEVIQGLPHTWTLPGRAAGMSLNKVSLGLLTGAGNGARSPEVPVRRLG